MVSPSYTRGYPLVMRAGRARSVEDVDGNVFLDCAAGIAVNATGHSHPDVVRAIVEQAQQFLHMSGTDFYYEPQVQLAEELAAIAPIARRRAVVLRQLRHRGHRGVPQAGALCDRPPQHHRVSRRASTAARMGALSLTASKAIQRRGFGPMMPGVYHAPYPDCYRCPLGLTPDNCAAECLDFIEHQLFVHLVSPDEVAAIVVEPIQGEGGYVVAPDEFLQRLRELTTQARHPAGRRRSAVGHGADRARCSRSSTRGVRAGRRWRSRRGLRRACRSAWRWRAPS